MDMHNSTGTCDMALVYLKFGAFSSYSTCTRHHVPDVAGRVERSTPESGVRALVVDRSSGIELQINIANIGFVRHVLRLEHDAFNKSRTCR